MLYILVNIFLIAVTAASSELTKVGSTFLQVSLFFKYLNYSVSRISNVP